MSFFNTIEHKENSNNGKLLSLLSRRKANSLIKLKNQWPGKHTPGLVNIYPNKILNSTKKVDPIPSKFQTQKELCLKKNGNTSKGSLSMSLIKGTSNSLGLKPTARTSVVETSQNWRTTKNRYSQKDMQEISSINKESYHGDSHFHNSKINNTIQNPTLKNIKNPSPKVSISDYVVDYSTFDFVGKVIDNPERWMKYIHKKIDNKGGKIDKIKHF